MNATTALVVLGAILLLTAVIGIVLRRNAQRTTHLDDRGGNVDPSDFGVDHLGERGTIVQFSTEFCARCPGVRRVIRELVDAYTGIDFVHVDLTHQPQLANKYHLLQTPTVLMFDGGGVPRTRLSGAITRQTLDDELAALTGGRS